MNIVRYNLMNEEGYEPYCPHNKCGLTRAPFNGEQFQCPCCDWVSSFGAEFIIEYIKRWGLDVMVKSLTDDLDEERVMSQADIDTLVDYYQVRPDRLPVYIGVDLAREEPEQNVVWCLHCFNTIAHCNCYKITAEAEEWAEAEREEFDRPRINWRCITTYLSSAVFVIIVLISLTGCATDYRTDYERNNDIVLTEDQIMVREAYVNEKLMRQQRWEDEIHFRNAIRLCAARNQTILECL